MNSFGIFPIIQQYTTFEYIKKKIYEQNLLFKRSSISIKKQQQQQSSNH